MYGFSRCVTGIAATAVTAEDVTSPINTDGMSLAGARKVDRGECPRAEQEPVVRTVCGFPVVADDGANVVNSQRPREYRAREINSRKHALAQYVSMNSLIVLACDTEVPDDCVRRVDTCSDSFDGTGIINRCGCLAHGRRAQAEAQQYAEGEQVKLQ